MWLGSNRSGHTWFQVLEQQFGNINSRSELLPWTHNLSQLMWEESDGSISVGCSMSLWGSYVMSVYQESAGSRVCNSQQLDFLCFLNWMRSDLEVILLYSSIQDFRVLLIHSTLCLVFTALPGSLYGLCTVAGTPEFYWKWSVISFVVRAMSCGVHT